VLPCNKDVRSLENVCENVKERVRKREVSKGALISASCKKSQAGGKKKDG